MDPHSRPYEPGDPLGLDAVVRALLAAQDALASDRGSHAHRQVAQALELARRAQERFAQLADRYALLRRTNAAMCEELLWLRDQLEDMLGDVY